MEKKNAYRLLAGIIVIGSIWGMLECILGSIKFSGTLEAFPMGALLGGFVGLGLMSFSRRMFQVRWMQLGMAVVAGILRFWAPVGTCVICSALAIVAEGLVFELIFNRPTFNIANRGWTTQRSSIMTLGFLGVVAGFTIYFTGYVFTQIMTPVITTGIFTPANFIAVLPLIYGKSFFAAALGALALPIAVLAKVPSINLQNIPNKHYYGTASSISVMCWVVVFAFYYL